MEKLQALQKGRKQEKPTGGWSSNGHHPIIGSLPAEEKITAEEE